MNESHQAIPLFSPLNTADKLLGKKLALRLNRVDLLLSIVEKLDSYQGDQPDQSVDGVRELVGRIIACSRYCTELYADFERLAHIRQMCYAEGNDSLKATAILLWKSFVKELPPRKLSYQILQVIGDRLRNQQAFAPPTNLFRPNGAKALRLYQQSYESLFEGFELLLAIVQTFGFHLTNDTGQFDRLLIRIQAADAQVEEALAKLIAKNEERIRLYEELRVRTCAVVDQVKQIYGSSHPVYLRVRYCKV